MNSRRCALALLSAALAVAEDSMWSGAAPSQAFTGTAEADNAPPSKASQVSKEDKNPPLVRSAGMDDEVVLKSSTTSAAPPVAIAETAHPPQSTESRLASGWVLVLVVSAVAAFGALAAYAMGLFTRGKRVPRRTRALAAPEVEEQRQVDGAMEMPNIAMMTPGSVVTTTAAPLATYQLSAYPVAAVPAAAPTFAAPVAFAPMSATAAYNAEPLPSYSTPPVPAYSTSYAVAPAAFQPAAQSYAVAPAAFQPAAQSYAVAPAAFQPAAMMTMPMQPEVPPPVMAQEPLPVPTEPLPVA